jgi:hypothetical protein
MRGFLFFAGILMLAGCTTPITAMNAPAKQQQVSGATMRDEEPPVPVPFRRPPRQFGHWGGTAYGGMY